MSRYYDLGAETLWNPSNGAARFFGRQAALFEAELGLAAGIGPMENDGCRIDLAASGEQPQVDRLGGGLVEQLGEARRP